MNERSEIDTVTVWLGIAAVAGAVLVAIYTVCK